MLHLVSPALCFGRFIFPAVAHNHLSFRFSLTSIAFANNTTARSMRSSAAFHFPALSFQPRCNASPNSGTDPPTARRPRPPSSTQSSTAVILMRHGMTDWNFAGRVQGGLDKSRLNHIGTRQARDAGRCLRNLAIDAIFCSPLSRARDTLNIASASSDNPALFHRKPELLPSLAEIQVPWQGLQKREIGKSVFSEAYFQYAKNPPRFSWNGFSPLGDIVRRAKDVWDTVARSNGCCQLLVSHNQMNKALICAALGLPTELSGWRQGNCCFNVFIVENRKSIRMRLCNGGDNASGASPHRRHRVRHGCMRIFLHQEGSTDSLSREAEGKHISACYIIGEASSGPYHSFANESCGERFYEHLDFHGSTNEELCASATSALEHMRGEHAEQCIIIAVKNSAAVRAFFAVSIGLGAEGMNKLISDPGGVSVFDVKVRAPVGADITYVERFNVGAWSTPDPLFRYTLLRERQLGRLD